MKILVVNPGVRKGKGILERPGGPMSIAEFLMKKKFDCTFLELCGRKITRNSIKRIALSRPCDFLLLSVMGGEFVERAIKIGREWKRIDENVIVIGGGSFVTNHLASRPKLWSGLPFDILVGGAGEWILPDMLIGRPAPPEKPVLIHGRSGDLDELPSPCTYLKPDSYIAEWDGYLPARRTFQIITSRGCPYRCIFCHQNSGAEKKEVKVMSAGRVVEVCERLVREHRIGGFYFVDDLLSVMPDRLHRFAELKLNHRRLKDIPFFGDFRTTDFSKKRVDLDLLAKSGLKHVYFGLESGSDHVLERVGKDCCVEDHIQAIRMLRKKKIRITGSFVIALPFETENDLRKTHDFMKNTALEYSEVHIDGSTWRHPETGRRTGESLEDLIRRSHWGILPDNPDPAVSGLWKKILGLQRRPGLELSSVFQLALGERKKWMKTTWMN